jgi:hypothetical protein
MKWRFYLLTWLYSIVLNAVLATIALVWKWMIVIKNQPAVEIIGDALQDAKEVVVFSIPFSAPGLVALVLGAYLSEYFMAPRLRFVFVVVFCLSGTLAGYCLLWISLPGINLFREFLFFIPISLVAVVAALRINRRRFYKAFVPGGLQQLV